MTVIPYVFYKGTCQEAFTTYARIFGSAAPEFYLFGEMPEEDKARMPAVPDDAVMHGAVKINETQIYGSDDLFGEFIPMAGCSLSVTLKDAAETKRVFEALAEGGEVRMPLEQTFFSPAFGTLTDRFGIRWMVMADNPEA